MEEIRFRVHELFPPTPPDTPPDIIELSPAMSLSYPSIASYEPPPPGPPSYNDDYLNDMPEPNGLDMLLYYYSLLCGRYLPPHMHRRMPQYVQKMAWDAKMTPWIASRPAENNLVLDQLLEVNYLRETMEHLYPRELQVRKFEPLIIPGYPRSPLIYHMTLGLAQDNHLRVDDHIRMLFLENFYSRWGEGPPQQQEDRATLCVKFHETLTKGREELLSRVSMVTMAYIWITRSGHHVYNGFYL
jgi:hypothetical protein